MVCGWYSKLTMRLLNRVILHYVVDRNKAKNSNGAIYFHLQNFYFIFRTFSRLLTFTCQLYKIKYLKFGAALVDSQNFVRRIFNVQRFKLCSRTIPTPRHLNSVQLGHRKSPAWRSAIKPSLLFICKQTNLKTLKSAKEILVASCFFWDRP